MARTTLVATRRKKKSTKSQPQWDELEQWCQDTTIQLNRMDKKLNAILALGQPSNTVSAELETAIKKTGGLAAGIDQKVPDEPKKKKK